MRDTKILVIDDSKLIVKLVKKALLENMIDGCHFSNESILTAFNGFSAFDQFGKHSDIEYVVTDVNMPDLNGDELIEALEDTGRLKDTKVMFITTQTISKGINKSSLQRSMGVIHKPFSNISFCNRFNELLEKKLQQEKEIALIKQKQLKQKKFLLNVLNNYFSQMDGVNVSSSNIEHSMQQYFSDNEDIQDRELVDIAFYIANDFLDGYNQKIELKSIECAFYKHINHFEENETKEFFHLKKTFRSSIDAMIKMTNKKYKASMVFSNVDILLNKIKDKALKYPQKDFKQYSQYLSYIVDELANYECKYKNKTLTILLGNINELINFMNLFKRYEKESLLAKELKISKEFENICNQYFFKFVYKIENILTYYLGWIDLYMWRRFFTLKEFKTYRDDIFHAKLANTYNFLMIKEKINNAQYNRFRPKEYDNIVVLSNDVDILTFFRDKISKKVENYRFHIFAIMRLLEIWSEKNNIDRVIIDIDFRVDGFGNGLDFLYHLKTMSIYFQAFYMQRIYLLVNDKKYSYYTAQDLKIHIIRKSDIKENFIKDKLFHT